MIEKFYSELLVFLEKSNIEFKLVNENGVDFTASDIDFILRHPGDLKKIKKFVSNYGIQTLIRTNNKRHFYFIVVDDENIHAFDFMVGLISSSGVICSGDYFFQSSKNGVGFKENYQFLKDSSKHQDLFYVVKENRKSLFTRMKIFSKRIVYYLKHLFSRQQSQGLYLVLLGADGSGKSTASEYITQSFSLKRKLFQLKRIYFKPNVIKIKPDNKISLHEGNIPHGHSTYSSLLSICKVMYIFINYLLYAPVLYLRKKCGHLIIFDRHFYDMLIDEKRYRINNTGLLFAKKLAGLIPKPDAVITLNSEVPTLEQRKPNEVTRELLVNLNEKYKNFYFDRVKVDHISNNGTIEEFKQKLHYSVLKSIRGHEAS
ncbi:hypothetical protein [Legionella hackeliae]|uniref:Thymidylate kinase n=1 Tax=Legionella hackeliae TaxID=449 RepID=A0A0A8UT23_LEGHA|nr:hypothetical protein [Legionella hackeliae]KTD08804.1 hypothetical protein Lhac_3027 [Legionella hackeliae]CEK10232.1 protein of unknown function [Legionella hackeliae]STX46961.1 Uncharacterised protein [Legionella hackeliae]